MINDCFVELPKKLFVESADKIIHWLYGDKKVENPDDIKSSCILTVDNANALLLNQIVRFENLLLLRDLIKVPVHF